MGERRKDQRIAFIARTQIVWTGPNGEMSISGTIEDRSVSGLGIEVSRWIAVGTSIRVKLGGEMIPAVVRRCIKTNFGSYLGVSFESFSADPTGGTGR